MISGREACAMKRWMPAAMPSGRQRAAGSLKPPPSGFVGWKPKPIVPWCRGKAPDQNPGTGETIEQIYSIGAFEQTE